MNLRSILQISLTVLLVTVTLRLGTGRDFYASTLISQFLAFALVSVCIFHFAVRHSSLDVIGVLGFTALLAGIDFRVFHFPVRNVAWLSFLGLGSFLILSLRLIWESQSSRKLLSLALIPSVLFVSSDWFASDLLDWTEKMHPRVLDLNLYAFDASLHVQLPFLLGQAFAKWQWFSSVSESFYVGLPIVIALVYSGLLLRSTPRAISAMLAFLITGPIGIVFYNMFPAMGPAHIFLQAFPWHPLSFSNVQKLVVEPLAIPGARNAIPSLHMGWVILAWWYSRGLPSWQRVIAALFLVFTFLSTMGTGEHYFIDLVAAVPFALFLKSLCSYTSGWKNPKRIAGILAGLFFLIGWLLLLRTAPKFFLVSAFFPWSLIVVTVAICLYLENRLEKDPLVSGTAASEQEAAIQPAAVA